jgi:superfamily II DNA/RNA helicase
VEISVLDEADHMADLGFLPAVRRLLDMTPPDGQRMLFSATLDAAVDVLARRFMNRPAHTTSAWSRHRSRWSTISTDSPATVTFGTGSGRSPACQWTSASIGLTR